MGQIKGWPFPEWSASLIPDSLGPRMGFASENPLQGTCDFALQGEPYILFFFFFPKILPVLSINN